MRLVLLLDNEPIHDRIVNEGPVLVGSDAACPIHVPDLSVELEHLRLLISPTGQWMAELVSPSTHALVNGREIDRRCPIYNGDELAVGRFVLTVLDQTDGEFGATGKTSLDELARIKDYPLPRGAEVKQGDEPITVPVEDHRAISRFAQELASTPDHHALMDRTLDYLVRTLPIRSAWFGMRREPLGPLEVIESRMSDGGPGRDPAVMSLFEYRCLDRGQCLRFRKIEDGISGLATPLDGRRGRFGVLYVESKRDVRLRREQLDLLFAIGLPVATRLETLLLGGGPERQVTEGSDPYALLRQVQGAVRPTSLPSWSGYEVGVYFKPGAQRGGDHYEFLTMPNGLASIMVAHATGEPADAAVILNSAHGAFGVAGLHGDPPRTLLRELAWLLQQRGSAGRLSAVNVVLNPEKGALEYCAAGQVGALIIDSKGSPRDLGGANVPPLTGGKIGDLPRNSEKLAPGETIALFTRGCATVRDESGTALKRERFLEALCNTFGLPPISALDEIQADLAPYFRHGHQPDDVVIALLRRD